MCVYVCVCMCLYLSVCERDRETERERMHLDLRVLPILGSKSRMSRVLQSLSLLANSKHKSGNQGQEIKSSSIHVVSYLDYSGFSKRGSLSHANSCIKITKILCIFLCVIPNELCPWIDPWSNLVPLILLKMLLIKNESAYLSSSKTK